MRRLTCGVGYNSKGKHKAAIDGKHTPAYRKWCSMLKRCYDSKNQKTQPNYIGCVVDENWHDFQNFAEWYNNNPYKKLDYELDKDILKAGNKTYGPYTCCLVPRQLNSLLVDAGQNRGRYPRGVSYEKDRRTFRANIRINGIDNNIGRFKTPEEAHQAYKVAKEANIKRMALEWQDRIANNVFTALMGWQITD